MQQQDIETGTLQTMVRRLDMPSIALIAALVFFVYDIFVDAMMEGEASLHLVQEAIVMLLVAWALWTKARDYLAMTQRLNKQSQEITQLRGNLSHRVGRQLAEWKLTPGETEIAWLIIKGFSFEEIAHLRGVKQKTARQQASHVYSKSATGNRSEFTALFLDQLFEQTDTPDKT